MNYYTPYIPSSYFGIGTRKQTVEDFLKAVEFTKIWQAYAKYHLSRT
jgi:hypothetical protein